MQRTNYRCVESLNISVEVAKCGKYSQIHPVQSLFVCYKKWLVLPEQSIHGKFQLIRMSSYAKNKQQICWVTQHQCRSRLMGKISQIHPKPSLLSVTKNDSSRLNNQFMVSFQHIMMSSNTKNKQQMCCVTQHQCRSRQIWKIFTNSPRALTFVCYKKWLV